MALLRSLSYSEKIDKKNILSKVLVTNKIGKISNSNLELLFDIFIETEYIGDYSEEDLVKKFSYRLIDIMKSEV